MNTHPLLMRPRFVTVAAVVLIIDALVGALAGNVLGRLAHGSAAAWLPLQLADWLLAGVQLALAVHLLRGGAAVRTLLALWAALVAIDLAVSGDLSARLHTDTLATVLQLNTVLLLAAVQALLWRPRARQWLARMRDSRQATTSAAFSSRSRRST